MKITQEQKGFNEDMIHRSDLLHKAMDSPGEAGKAARMPFASVRSQS